jgi:hypothetical protein
MQNVIELQGGLGGPFVTAQNAYEYLKRYFERGLRFKSADAFISDPAAQAQQGPAGPPRPPAPDAKLIEVQGRLSLEERRMQLEDAREREKMAREHALKREQMDLEARLQAVGPVRFGGAVG